MAKKSIRNASPPLETTVDQSSPKLQKADEEIVMMLRRMGFQHKRIAALFDVNQGRIAEIVRRNEPPKD